MADTASYGRVRGSKEGVLQEDYYLSRLNKMAVTREYIILKYQKGFNALLSWACKITPAQTHLLAHFTTILSQCPNDSGVSTICEQRSIKPAYCVTQTSGLFPVLHGLVQSVYRILTLSLGLDIRN